MRLLGSRRTHLGFDFLDLFSRTLAIAAAARVTTSTHLVHRCRHDAGCSRALEPPVGLDNVCESLRREIACDTVCVVRRDVSVVGGVVVVLAGILSAGDVAANQSGASLRFCGGGDRG